MKIYTKTGDDGTTGLIGGARVSKGDPRIECYGTVDELNAAVGWAAVACDAGMQAMLRTIQHELFVIGSHLALPNDKTPAGANLPALHISSIERLEKEIDAADAVLTPLRQFILPGGSEPAARLHLARTICRRSERLLITVAGGHKIEPAIVTYLNRLSDWLFVQARWMNKSANVEDIPWQK